MVKFTSNTKDVFGKMESQIRNLMNTDAIVRQAAFDALALVTNRIQQKGKNSQEEQMSDYTERYKKQRQKKGRQTSYKDLTFTGDMIRDFTVGPVTGGWGVGFNSIQQSKKAAGQEKKEGNIFQVSPKEQAIIQKGVDKNVAKFLST